LLTEEVEHLAAWLDAVAAGDTSANECGFTEPNLHFVVGSDTSGRGVLRVYFELESRPSWDRATAAGRKDLWLEFPLDELDLRKAASDLLQQSVRFPVRTSE
jgi:hypothetical protein